MKISKNILQWEKLAWLPIPLLLTVIVGLWVANLQTVYESRILMVTLNVFFTWFIFLSICVLTARGFLSSGQPSLFMFGCGSLLWGATSLTAAMLIDYINPTITIHNLGVFGAASCYFIGLLWRGQILQPVRWLVAGYSGILIFAGLIVWTAVSGWTPIFFVQGQGGTLIRYVVLFLAIVQFAWVAYQMIYKVRKESPYATFYYWYGLGLGLVATGLIGVMLLTVQGSILGWTNRLTQYLGSVYLFIAAVVAMRETGVWKISMTSIEEIWLKKYSLAEFRHQTFRGSMLRYSFAIVLVMVAVGLRLVLTAWIGPGLPTYVLFYPVLMAVAVLSGFGPGFVATILASLVAEYWYLSPIGNFAVASPVDRLGLVIFIFMGIFMSVFAELYRSNRYKAAAYDKELALRQNAKDFERAQVVGKIGNWRLNVQRNELIWSDENYRIFGLPKGMSLTYEIFLSTIHPDDREYVDKKWKAGMAGEDYDIEHRIIVEGEIKWVREKAYLEFDKDHNFLSGFGITQDITDRKLVEWEREIIMEFLVIINKSNDLKNMIKAAVSFIKKKSGFEAVGIRLKKGEDYPYFETSGFSCEFVLAETRLCSCGQDGKLSRDVSGYPIMECMCGNVIQGRFDQSKNFFTKRGSFWSNNTTELLATLTEAGRQTRIRNRCNGEGYESVGLFALRLQGVCLGLLQFNDTRKGMFTSSSLALWERLVDFLAVAISNFQSKEELLESRDQFRDLGEKLEAERKLLRTFIDNIPDYVYFKDTESKFLVANIATIQAMRCQALEDVLGKTDFDFYPKHLAEKYFADEQEIIKTGKQKIAMEEDVLDQYDNIKTILTSKVPIKDNAGNVIGVVGIGRDITKQKLVEQVLKRDKETFETLVQERTKELLEAQTALEQAKRLSDIGILAATVAHELRNPLAAIQMATYNIKRKANNSLFDSHLAIIEKKVGESDQIINNLLFYSRLKSPHYETINIFDLIEECVKYFKNSGKKEVVVIRSMDGIKGITIEADPLQIAEVFNNILNNAYDAVTHEKGQIKITAENEEKFIKVIIEDNGVGIEADILDKMFDPFFTTKAKGTGLGLSVCKQIINMHEGEIGVKSALAQGTSIIVCLPNKKRNKK